MLSAVERAQRLASCNGTRREFPPDRCLHDLVEAQVERTPDAIAVVFEDQRLTFRELNRRANRLAHHLRTLAVGPDVLVGVCAERSLEMVVALLGVLKAGGAYVPLDPGYPKDRLAMMLADSRPAVLLTQKRLVEILPEHDARVVLLDTAATAGEDAAALDANPVRVNGPEHLAYGIFTSGSTGKPKCAVNTHRGIVNRLLWVQEAYGLDESDRVLQKTPFSFDVSVTEFFSPLLTGARLVVAQPERHRDSGYLVETIVREGITWIHFVPPMLHAFLDHPRVETCRSLRRVVCSGEALTPDLRDRFFERLGANLLNLYGPTEAAVDVTYWACDRKSEERAVPIGFPIFNTQMYVLDADGEPLPAGEPGELYIGGLGVARGYLNRPELTAEKFVPDALGEARGGRLYRTGDLARYRPDGAIEYLGRLDHQVKVRGFRIELGEIESVLADHASIHEVAVVVREDSPGQKRIVAYYVPAAGAAPSAEDLRAGLNAKLPDYMVPSAFVALERLPLSPNGKLDRRALPAPAQPDLEAADAADDEPMTALETSVAKMWSDILQVTITSANANFFSLGGDSLRGANFTNRLEQSADATVYITTLFDAPTVRSFSAFLTAEYPDIANLLTDSSSGTGPSARGDDDRAELGAGDVTRLRGLTANATPPVYTSTSAAEGVVFLLAPPRSGSTLLRALLAGHSQLFAPPELDLLGFRDMGARKTAFAGRNSYAMEGLYRAVMNLHACGADAAKAKVAELEEKATPVARVYELLREWSGGRLLIDKTSLYSLSFAVLEQMEKELIRPKFIHLVRHPTPSMLSFLSAKIGQVFRYPHDFSPKALAEGTWSVSHENIVSFLARVPTDRWTRVSFEDLVSDPEATLRRLCEFMGVPFESIMLDLYTDPRDRMIDGVHAVSKPASGSRLESRRSIDPSMADSWRSQVDGELQGERTTELARALGYGTAAATAAATATTLARLEQGIEDAYPLVSGQRFFAQMGSPVFQGSLDFTGPLDVAALRSAFGLIVRRHATVRTTLSPDRTEQRVHFTHEVPWRSEDWGALDDAALEARRRAYFDADRTEAFDLDRGPLVRCALMRISDGRATMLVSAWHGIIDGWSMSQLFIELMDAYRQYLLVGTCVLEAPHPFREFVDAVQQQDAEEARKYWAQRFAPMREARTLDTTEAALQKRTGAFRRRQGGVYTWTLSRAESDAARSWSIDNRVSMQTLHQAAWALLLARRSERSDVVYQATVSGRRLRCANIDRIVGCTINVVVIPARVEPSMRVSALLQQIDTDTDRQAPFEWLPTEELWRAAGIDVPADLGVPPHFLATDGSFNFVPALDRRWSHGDLRASYSEIARAPLAVPMHLLIFDGRELGYVLRHNLACYDAAAATAIGQQYSRIIQSIISCDPDARASSLA